MNKKIFIACDTDKISEAKKIIKITNTSKLKIGYKFGIEFLNSKNGRNFVAKLKNKITFGDYKIVVFNLRSEELKHTYRNRHRH